MKKHFKLLVTGLALMLGSTSLMAAPAVRAVFTAPAILATTKAPIALVVVGKENPSHIKALPQSCSITVDVTFCDGSVWTFNCTRPTCAGARAAILDEIGKLGGN